MSDLSEEEQGTREDGGGEEGRALTGHEKHVGFFTEQEGNSWRISNPWGILHYFCVQNRQERGKVNKNRGTSDGSIAKIEVMDQRNA